MNTKLFKKTLAAGAVAAACAAPMLAQADFAATNIQFDRDGTGPSAPITISGIDWRPGTLLAKGLITSSSDGTDTSHVANNFTLYGQGQLSAFTGAPAGAGGMPGGSPPEELTYEFSVPMTPTAYLSDPLVVGSSTIQPGISATLNTASAGLNFFKIWYSNTGGLNANNQGTGDYSGNAESRSGSGFGGVGTQADGCGGPTTVGSEILVLCGVIVNDAGPNSPQDSQWSWQRNSGLAGAANIALDAAGAGIDNYDGTPDGTAPVGGIPDGTAIGTQAGTGSGALLISVVYSNSDFFKNTIFTKFEVDLSHTEASNLNFKNQTPYASVVGNTWDVGADTGPVPLIGGTDRFLNNMKCLNNGTADGTTNTCDFVVEGDGAISFQAFVVPEPGSLALLGLGMLGLGTVARRRRNGQQA